MTHPRRSPRVLAALLATGVAVAACSGGGATPSPAATPTPAPTASPAASPSAASVQLDVATSSLGTIVVDGSGRTLYLFTKDTNGDGKSVCNGDCAASWPPVVVDSATSASASSGVTGTLGTATRDDGSLQLTLGGWPLYYFKGDAAAGDTNGQGLNDVWFAVGADGSAVSAAPRGADGY